MYAVDPPLPIEQLDPGVYYVTGPPLSHKERLVREVLVNGLRQGENALLVSTDRSYDAIERTYAELLGSVPDAMAVVDCISEQTGGPGEQRASVTYPSSPGDLTGIGMYASEQLQRLAERSGSDRTRVVLDSVSTLLMYEDFRTVVRFLHVFGSRLGQADALAVFVLNTETHGNRVVETVLELADGKVEVRESEGKTEVRVVSAASPTEWREF